MINNALLYKKRPNSKSGGCASTIQLTAPDGLRWSVRFALMFALAIQSSTHAQSNVDEEPSFRPRTDANAVQDLKRLREELNRATDANGAINPLGNFLERSNRTKESARLEIGASESESDRNGPASHSTTQANRETESDVPRPKPRREIETLPGPRLTIIQQASPPIRSSADGFRPAQTLSDIDATVRPSLQYPVSLASSNLPIVGQPSNTIARYQSGPEIPSSGANSGIGLPPAFSGPPAFQPGSNPNPQPVLPGPTAPGFNPNGAGPPLVANPPLFSSPITDTQPIVNNPGLYNMAPPVYAQPAFNPSMPFNPNQGFSGGSPSDSVRPSYTPYVNGTPFVSNPPRQFDARNMVACRQSVDPCAQPCRSNPNGYASGPNTSGGSPFAYAPPTFMPYGRTSGYRPLFGFGQDSYDPFLGRGIVGQPVAYVDGQPVRNFIRYIFP